MKRVLTIVKLALFDSSLPEGAFENAIETDKNNIDRLRQWVLFFDASSAKFFLTHYVSASQLTHMFRSVTFFKRKRKLAEIDETFLGYSFTNGKR